MEVSVKISVGELLDRFSVLTLKKSFIKDEERLKDVKNEINELMVKVYYFLFLDKRIDYYYNMLINVNRDLWNIVDAVKGLDGKKYTQSEMLSFYSECFIKTTFRFMIKSKINIISKSEIVEQKDCAIKDIKYIYIQCGRDLLIYNAKINYLITYYNRTIIVVFEKYHSLARKLFNDPTVDFIDPKDLPDGINIMYPNEPYEPVPNFLDRYDLTDFKGKTINYLVGGRLGDMIHTLYVIMCNYKTYGIKGNLIVTNNKIHGGDTFLKEPSELLESITSILMKNNYLDSITYNNEDYIDYDINLNMFRMSPKLYTNNWLEIMMDTFSVPLDTYPYLRYYEDNEESSFDVSEYVLIHRKVTEDRCCQELTPFLNNIIKKNKCLYIYFGNDINMEFGESVRYHQIKNLKELMHFLKKSKFCISNQTGVLAFAFAMGIPVLCEHNVEKTYMGHENYNYNFFWISKSDKSNNFERLKKFINI